MQALHTSIASFSLVQQQYHHHENHKHHGNHNNSYRNTTDQYRDVYTTCVERR